MSLTFPQLYMIGQWVKPLISWPLHFNIGILITFFEIMNSWFNCYTYILH